MSEMINTKSGRGIFRRQLLTTVSALALLTSIYEARDAKAAQCDADSPPIWIELGGQFDQLSAGQSPWQLPSPPFGENTSPPLDHPPPTAVGAIPHIGFDADGKISFRPDGSDWILSAAVRYGRASRGPKVTKDQSYNTAGEKYGHPTTKAYVATRAETTERHAILDFQAGKDVGLGMGLSHSIVNFGVRIAQFDSRLNVHANSRHSTIVPTANGGHGTDGFGYRASALPYGDADIRHSFTGLGPSISWDASIPVLGRAENGISFDWNAMGAILFGRQKTTAQIATKDTVHFYSQGITKTKIAFQTNRTTVRSRQVLVPNVGGLLGISYRKSNLKLTMGYRADFFFGAIDGGVDARKTYDRGFFGPFARISIGIGG